MANFRMKKLQVHSPALKTAGTCSPKLQVLAALNCSYLQNVCTKFTNTQYNTLGI